MNTYEFTFDDTHTVILEAIGISPALIQLQRTAIWAAKLDSNTLMLVETDSKGRRSTLRIPMNSVETTEVSRPEEPHIQLWMMAEGVIKAETTTAKTMEEAIEIGSAFALTHDTQHPRIAICYNNSNLTLHV